MAKRSTKGDVMKGVVDKFERELVDAQEIAYRDIQYAGLWEPGDPERDTLIRQIIDHAATSAYWPAWHDGFSTGAGVKYLAAEQAAGIPLHNRGPHPAVDPHDHRLIREAALARYLNEPGELLGFLDRVHALYATGGPIDRDALGAILTEAGYPQPLAAAEDDGCPRNDPDCTSRADACHDACERPASAAAAINQSATAAYNAIRNMLGGTHQ